MHDDPVDVGHPRVEDVVPGESVERTGRVDLGLPVGGGAQVLGQLAHRGLRAPHDLRPVARRHERHLLAHGRPTTAAMASTSRAADRVPGQLGRPAPPRSGQHVAQAVVGAGPMEGGRHVGGVGGRQEQGGIGHRVRHGARARPG